MRSIPFFQYTAKGLNPRLRAPTEALIAGSRRSNFSLRLSLRPSAF
jgi:hypothetical protein